MGTYELVIVLDGKATSAKKKSVVASIEKLVGILSGKILNTQDWGVRELAYKINKSDTGLFLIFNLELSPESAAEIGNKIKLEADVIRYLLLSTKQ